jgi:MarR family 2-MHQ and catechol resistance regulon transcriptional repressor
MRNDILEKLALDLLSIPPLIFRLIRRKLVLPTMPEIEVDLKLLHFEIMRVLKEEGTLHPAEIGDRLLITKAQMTYLVDKLVEWDFVRREMDANDRRTINITLTEKGDEVLEEQDNLVINAMRENMSSLTEGELEALCNSLRNLRDILFKLQ